MTAPAIGQARRTCAGRGPNVENGTATTAPPIGGAASIFTTAVPADPGQLAPTRERLRGWLHASGVAERDVEAVLIATGEACANAIEHGYRFAVGESFTLRAELRNDRLEIEVRDHGGWRASANGLDADRGRGRLIMARLMDEATVVGTPEGTTVRLVKRLSRG
ncbi:ATP-binding protein [Micromonospora sp. NPDC006766]|uniref:ATP-binding protein n=1 Tax=Micromonospora sp. NPDC006766 TaxID=3154778 RepID=UPI0033CD5732